MVCVCVCVWRKRGGAGGSGHPYHWSVTISSNHLVAITSNLSLGQSANWLLTYLTSQGKLVIKKTAFSPLPLPSTSHLPNQQTAIQAVNHMEAID